MTFLLGRSGHVKSLQKKPIVEMGSVVDGYTIAECLGTGTFGTAFAGTKLVVDGDSTLPCEVAIKFSAAGAFNAGEALKREAKLLMDLKEGMRAAAFPSAPVHIILILSELKSFCDTPYYVMERCGPSLADVLARGRKFVVEDVRWVGRYLMRALKFLFDKRIIHRDVKPSNILLVNRDGAGNEIKLCDFGRATRLHEGQISLKRGKDAVSHRSYTPPEVILYLPYDTGLDVWAAACVLAELLLKSPVFPGRSEKDVQLAQMELLDVPPGDMLARSSSVKITGIAPQARQRFDKCQVGGVPRAGWKPSFMYAMDDDKSDVRVYRVPGTKSLHEKLGLPKDSPLVTLLLSCFNQDPEQRPSAAGVLISDRFLTQTVGESLALARQEDAARAPVKLPGDRDSHHLLVAADSTGSALRLGSPVPSPTQVAAPAASIELSVTSNMNTESSTATDRHTAHCHGPAVESCQRHVCCRYKGKQ